jgi:hypothetical protein
MVMIMLSWLFKYSINVNYLDDVYFMHVIVYRCKPNISIN